MSPHLDCLPWPPSPPLTPLPPQVVIVPIVKKDTDRASVSEAVDKLCGALKAAGVRVKVGAWAGGRGGGPSLLLVV